MAEISANAACGRGKRKKASIENYAKVEGMTIVNLDGEYMQELERAHVPNMESVARDIQEIRNKLKERKFEDVSLRYCTHAGEQPPHIERLAGFYHKRPRTVNGQAHYQQIKLN